MCCLSSSLQFHQYCSQLTSFSWKPHSNYSYNSSYTYSFALATHSLFFLSSPKWIPRFCSSSNPFQCQYLFQSLLYSSQTIPCLRRIQKIKCANHNSLCFKVVEILKPLWQHLAGHEADRTCWHTCWECVLNADMWRPQLLRNWDLCAPLRRLLLLHAHQKLGFDLWLIFEARRGHIQTNKTYICYLIQEPRSRSH